MTKMEAEIMRAKSNVEYCQGQFNEAVRFADRMASELKRAAEAGWNMGCPANNLANAAVEVGRIGERLETLKETLKTLTSLGE